MPPDSPRLLVVDDISDNRIILSRRLVRRGFEVVKAIRQSHSPSALPVIMVTANGQSADTVAALTLGANDYVTKPVDFPVALARIEAHVARKHAEEALRLTND